MASVPTSTGGRYNRNISTAAGLIIGNEILGGKTVDTNSAVLAKWCFASGMELKRIETIEDDEDEIIEAVKRMSERYDFVVTSGGIGPTHDDITYLSIAKAFGLPLVRHEEAYQRMQNLSKQDVKFWDVDSPAKTAKLRMVTLPIDESHKLADQVLFPRDDMWVPVSVVNGNVHILPGVPQLFEKLLTGLSSLLAGRLVDSEGRGLCRVIISTPLSESEAAEDLRNFQQEVAPKGVNVGSYSRYQKNNLVTLVGRDHDYIESIVPKAVDLFKGRQVAFEGEDDEPEQPVAM
ncbi:molybdenum cofactor synthesis domain-containing protein [Nemania diffusa]|nr:molybdenum cofactor synthesis domain-containing protein [Nemania diffusa]